MPLVSRRHSNNWSRQLFPKACNEQGLASACSADTAKCAAWNHTVISCPMQRYLLIHRKQQKGYTGLQLAALYNNTEMFYDMAQHFQGPLACHPEELPFRHFNLKFKVFSPHGNARHSSTDIECTTVLVTTSDTTPLTLELTEPLTSSNANTFDDSSVHTCAYRA
eukprot:scaffold64277_cov19-Tisochrysis_lutea.AAC.1